MHFLAVHLREKKTTDWTMEKLLKINEVAEILQVKESTIRAWIFRKKIPFKKIHNNIRFRQKEIDDFIDGKWGKTPL